MKPEESEIVEDCALDDEVDRNLEPVEPSDDEIESLDQEIDDEIFKPASEDKWADEDGDDFDYDDDDLFGPRSKGKRQKDNSVDRWEDSISTGDDDDWSWNP